MRMKGEDVKVKADKHFSVNDKEEKLLKMIRVREFGKLKAVIHKGAPQESKK